MSEPQPYKMISSSQMSVWSTCLSAIQSSGKDKSLVHSVRNIAQGQVLKYLT